MSKSLVDIKDNKLVYNTNIGIFDNFKDKNKQIKVVSIIGKARTGKSTFLNCLISYWKDDSETIFKMGDTQEHCTHGIDMYYLQNQNIILLDFQGIFVGDSSNDSKLLLLAYLSSDIIIFNEVKMLNNGTLSQFAPMLAFINDMKDKNNTLNPMLIFRIGDVSLDLEPSSNMLQMLASENDQFQSIRECIIQLFEDKYAIHTNMLDRKEIKMMNDGKFNELLKIEENGFFAAISKINNYLEGGVPNKSINTFISDLLKNIKCINDSKKIDFKKLDVVQNLAQNEIKSHILKLDKSIYIPIIVDGTTENYKNITSRRIELNRIIEELKTKFKAIPKTIRDEEIKAVKEEISKIIDIAEAENEKKANELLNTNIKTVLFHPIPFSLSITFDDLDKLNFDTLIKPFTDKLDIITDKSQHIHSIAIDPFDKWKVQIIKNIKNRYKIDLCSTITITDYYEKICSDFNTSFLSTLDEKIKTLVYDRQCYEPYDNIIKVLDTEYINELNTILKSKYLDTEIVQYEILKQYKFTCALPIENGNCDIKEEILNYYTVNKTYNIEFQNIYNKYSKQFTDNIKTNCIEIIASYRNERLTELGYISIQPVSIDVIITTNPKTQFITFAFGAKKELMTQQYYENNLEQVLLRTCKKCFDKDYIYNEDEPQFAGWLKFLKDITDIKVYSADVKLYQMDFEFYKKMFATDYVKLAKLEIFENKFKKELIRGGYKEVIKAIKQ
jgi:hypothetical protein